MSARIEDRKANKLRYQYGTVHCPCCERPQTLVGNAILVLNCPSCGLLFADFDFTVAFDSRTNDHVFRTGPEADAVLKRLGLV